MEVVASPRQSSGPHVGAAQRGSRDGSMELLIAWSSTFVARFVPGVTGSTVAGLTGSWRVLAESATVISVNEDSRDCVRLPLPRCDEMEMISLRSILLKKFPGAYRFCMGRNRIS